MIWSVIPEDVVLEGWEKPLELKQINYHGKTILVSESGGQQQIVRLVSSNPGDYMDERFLPGKIIKK